MSKGYFLMFVRSRCVGKESRVEITEFRGVYVVVLGCREMLSCFFCSIRVRREK